MMYTIRNVSPRTKELLNRYAEEHNLTMAEALGQLVDYGVEYHMQNKRNPKRYADVKGAMAGLPEW
ncbi:MAG: hypothetical protein AB1295_04160 [Candidatus Micrarchaeota archaeon]